MGRLRALSCRIIVQRTKVAFCTKRTFSEYLPTVATEISVIVGQGIHITPRQPALILLVTGLRIAPTVGKTVISKLEERLPSFPDR